MEFFMNIVLRYAFSFSGWACCHLFTASRCRSGSAYGISRLVVLWKKTTTTLQYNTTGKSGLELRQLPKPHQHRSTFDRLRPIASRPPKIPKNQYEIGSIFEPTRTPPPQNASFVNERASSKRNHDASLVVFILSSRILQSNQRDRHWIAESAESADL